MREAFSSFATPIEVVRNVIMVRRASSLHLAARTESWIVIHFFAVEMVDRAAECHRTNSRSCDTVLTRCYPLCFADRNNCKVWTKTKSNDLLARHLWSWPDCTVGVKSIQQKISDVRTIADVFYLRNSCRAVVGSDLRMTGILRTQHRGPHYSCHSSERCRNDDLL